MKWNVFAASSLVSRIFATNLLGGFNISFFIRTPLTKMIDNMLQGHKCNQSKNEHGEISLTCPIDPFLISRANFYAPVYTTPLSGQTDNRICGHEPIPSNLSSAERFMSVA